MRFIQILNKFFTLIFFMSIVVLGIDPGYARCGWGVVSYDSDVRYVAHGCIETPSSDVFSARLYTIGQEIGDVIQEFTPNRIAIEELYFKQNTTNALGVVHARGVLCYIAHKYGICVDSIQPSQVKQSVAGYGKADKRQVQEMVKIQFGLKEIPRPDDSADALAVAMTGAFCYRTLSLQ